MGLTGAHLGTLLGQKRLAKEITLSQVHVNLSTYFLSITITCAFLYIQGFKLVRVNDCWHKSLVPLMEQVRSYIGQGPVYLSFDIDALDPACAPGTGTSDTLNPNPAFSPGTGTSDTLNPLQKAKAPFANCIITL